MAGTLGFVWSRVWGEIWSPLGRSSAAPSDLFSELIQGLIREPIAPIAPNPPSPTSFNNNGELIDPTAIASRDEFELIFQKYRLLRDDYESASSGINSRNYFRAAIAKITTEKEAIEALECGWEVLESFAIPSLSIRYRKLVESFIDKYSLRYALREPFLIHTTLPGLLSQLMSDIKKITHEETHLQELYFEFEESLADLKRNRSPMRIKACLQRQFILLEAFAARCPGVKAQTLGAMCDELDWPHATIRDVGKKLYGFRSNYPGLGHAGNPQSVMRQVGMKDFVSLSLMLAAFTPYVAHALDPDRCYSAE